MICHLANAQYYAGPAGGNTGRFFLSFGGPVCTDRISNCPLDRVFSYCIPGRKTGILRIQYGQAAAAAEISFWTR